VVRELALPQARAFVEIVVDVDEMEMERKLQLQRLRSSL
jgi:hypothetical protein